MLDVGWTAAGIGGGITPAIPSVQVPPYQYHNEGLHGIRDTCNLGRGGVKLYSTMFPQVTGMVCNNPCNLQRLVFGLKRVPL